VDTPGLDAAARRQYPGLQDRGGAPQARHAAWSPGSTEAPWTSGREGDRDVRLPHADQDRVGISSKLRISMSQSPASCEFLCRSLQQAADFYVAVSSNL